MYRIKLNGTFIDLSPGTRITIEIPSTLFLGGNIERYLQPHTMPVDIPATPTNINIVGAAHVVQARGVLYREIPCELWLNGSLWRSGQAFIQSARQRTYRMSMVFNPYSSLNNINLQQLDLGGERDFGTGLTGPGSKQEYMKLTALTPEDYDYTFIPLTNYRKYDDMDTNEIGDSDPAEAWWQNHYDSGEENYKYITAVSTGGHAPNVKLSYLLERIFNRAGYGFTNLFQTTPELLSLYHYSNHSILDADGDIADKIWLNQHVPDMQAKDYLRGLMNMFSLGFAEDPIEQHITLYTTKYLLSLGPGYNWTGKLHRDPEVSQQFEYPGEFEFAQPVRFEASAYDAIEKNLDRYTDMGEVDTEADVPGIGATVVERYFICSRNAYVLRTPGSSTFTHYLADTEALTVEADREKVSSEIGTLLMTPPGEIDKAGPHSRYTPWLEQAMTYKSLDQKHDIPNRLLFYRGFVTDPDNVIKTKPTGSTTAYDWEENRVWDHSLQWRGDYGLYNVFWRPWREMLDASRQVDCMLQLTATDLHNLKLWRKVHITGTSYFIKSLTVTLTQSGVLPTKAVLLSCDS